MRLFFIRGLVALAWAAVFATASDSLSTGAAVLLVAYPLIDVVASLIDARGQSGPPRTFLRFGAATSALAAAAIAVAATGTIAAVLAVFGAWAIVSGVAQVIVARRRRAELGSQWPMLAAGALSALTGIVYAADAAGANPTLDAIAVYATGGGSFFVVQAALLAWRQRRAPLQA